MDLAAGARLGPYEVLSPLGAGGMGEVYRARDSRLGRDVALKVVLTQTSSDPDRLRRFELEARAASAINHPNILAVFDVGSHDGAPYVVSELLEGETLRDRMSGALPQRKALELAVQIAEGLAAAHEKGIVHRDLKPENVFVTKDGRAKILDFGLAKLRQDGEGGGNDSETATQAHETGAGVILGTVGYMSPEQVRGEAVDHRSDVFSFGAVLYEMLTRKRAFRRDTAAETMTAILREDPPPLHDVDPNLPPALDRVVRRCLEKKQEERFQSARDLAFAIEALSAASGVSLAPATLAAPPRRGRSVALAAVALVALGAAFVAGERHRPPAAPPSFHRLTFKEGAVWSARFAPDGETIVYSAAWQRNRPMDVFSTRRGSRESRELGLPDAKVWAISSSGEMAVGLAPEQTGLMSHLATLARVPLAGGAPREVQEDVLSADWSPDGRDLAVVRKVADRSRLEYPLGKTLYEAVPPASLLSARVSPDGVRVAAIEQTTGRGERGLVTLFDKTGRRTVLTEEFASLNSLAWSADGSEILFCGSREAIPNGIFAVSLSGSVRVALRLPGPTALLDVSRQGRLLVRHGSLSAPIVALPPGETREREISELAWSFVDDLSADGRMILGTESAEGGGEHYSVFVKKTEGSPAVWLGEGDGQALSPDGRWALVRVERTPEQLVLLPTGAGEPKTIANGSVKSYLRANWLPDGRGIVFAGREAGQEPRLYVQDLVGGPPRAVSAPGLTLPPIGRAVSPDGRFVVALDMDQGSVVQPLSGGEAEPARGLEAGDVPISWTDDGRALFVARYQGSSASVFRIERADGRERLWKEFIATPAQGQIRVFVTPDGKSYVYNYGQSPSVLYLVE